MGFKVQVHSEARFVLPSRLRKELLNQIGDEIVLKLEDGSIRLIPIQQAVKIAQHTVRIFIPDGKSLIDVLFLIHRADEKNE